MKSIRSLTLTLLLGALLSSTAPAASEVDAGQLLTNVGRLLEQGHYTRHELDDDISRRLLKNYLDALDYTHLLFTQEDVALFEKKYATTLDDDISLGNPDAAYAIYDLYAKRLEARVAWIKELLKKGEFTFESDGTTLLNRQKAEYPKDMADADRLWRDRIEGELLQEKLNEHAIDPGPKVVQRRYDNSLRNLHEQTREDVIKIFLSSLATTYDPHSEYLSRSDLENFSINMRLSLVGIGAVLQSEDGYAKIMDLVPGGPAESDGRLKVGDRIAAVAQEKTEFVDTVDMKLDKVVEMIRGKKGTTVRLQVVPADATDPSRRKVIEIVRDEVKLKDQQAKAEIIEQPVKGGPPRRIGWITLPSFYADMDRSSSENAKSTTKDVRALLERLKKENISGLVFDLRRNGGGSLEEAVNLTGLFVKRGPVVQTRDSNDNINVSKDRDRSVAYDGPMVVLTNRLSASASEIFAAALQDYGRAVIVGDPNTFGKGTVQTMLEIGRFIPFLGRDANAGALKLTIQKFYRIAGGSTQLRGVVSDIRLPSPFDHPEFGESSLKDPLPYDVVPPADFEKVEDQPLFLDDLRARSTARVATDPEFAYLLEDLKRTDERLARNTISLNEKERRAEMEEAKARKKDRLAARAEYPALGQNVFEITLDNLTKPGLEPAKLDKKKKPDPDDAPEGEDAADEAAPKVDPVRVEALNIVSDLVDLSRTPKTASTQQAQTDSR